jgi:hypothetical protein
MSIYPTTKPSAGFYGGHGIPIEGGCVIVILKILTSGFTRSGYSAIGRYIKKNDHKITLPG